MIFGRIIFGIGGESICVASSSLLQKWFEFGEVALAMGMCLSISRIGSVTNNIVSPYLANHFQSLNIPFFFSCCLILVGLLSSFVVIYIGRYADRLINNGGGGDDHSKSNKDNQNNTTTPSIFNNMKKIFYFPFIRL